MYTQSLHGKISMNISYLGFVDPSPPVEWCVPNQSIIVSMSIGCIGKLGQPSGFLWNYLSNMTTRYKDIVTVSL